MAFPYVTATRRRGTPGSDPYHQIDWSDPAEVTIEGCLLDPGGSTVVDEVSRQAIVTQPTLYAPHGADIVALDRVVVRGRTWDVVGDPADWGDDSDDLGGLVVKLKAASG